MVSASRFLHVLVDGFTAWVITFAVLAYLVPAPFEPLKPLIQPGLGLIMFGMGMTLSPGDFARVARMPRAALCGICGQFTIMPLLAWLLVSVFDIGPELSLGFIILGSCPGGTASNVISYLARADVALSVTMTACTTLIAVVATPLLIGLLGSQYLPVDVLALFRDVVTVVLIPVAAGVCMKVWFRHAVDRANAVFPAISVTVIVLIIACIVALSREKLPQVIGITGLIVVLHNVLGLGLGYALATLMRLPKTARRTIAIEVGMQNSGLGVTLAQSTGVSALVALPASLFSVVHNITGSMLASIWRRRTPK